MSLPSGTDFYQPQQMYRSRSAQDSLGQQRPTLLIRSDFCIASFYASSKLKFSQYSWMLQHSSDLVHDVVSKHILSCWMDRLLKVSFHVCLNLIHYSIATSKSLGCFSSSLATDKSIKLCPTWERKNLGSVCAIIQWFLNRLKLLRHSKNDNLMLEG